jgi:flavin reductase (DIM6/NTAB) family NADH-FMN oxidoreductase RutF
MNLEDRVTMLHKIPYGVYFLTTKESDPNSTQPFAGALISWVSQVSFEPSMIMVALKRDSRIQRAVAQSRCFALNFLASDQKPMAERLSKEITIEGKKMNDYDFELGGAGVPILKACMGYLECRVGVSLDKGDHTMVIAEILNAQEKVKNQDNLLLRDTDWKYSG